MNLRPMLMSDADKMLEWKNYGETRKFAIQSDLMILREDHIKFLEKNIEQFQVIINDNDTPVGAVRIESHNEVSIWIDRLFRQRHYAYLTIKDIAQSGMSAKIVNGNIGSFRAFVKNGFYPVMYNEDYNYYLLKKQ